MECPHDFFNTGSPVPPMNIKKVDVVGSQVLEGILEGEVEGFRTISRV